MNCYGYVRPSHPWLRFKGSPVLGTISQQNSIYRWAHEKVETFPVGHFQWKGFFTDDPEHCQVPLAERPSGRSLCKMLVNCDYVVATSPDRLFGTLKDMGNTLLDWDCRNISVIFTEELYEEASPLYAVIQVLATHSKMRMEKVARLIEKHYTEEMWVQCEFCYHLWKQCVPHEIVMQLCKKFSVFPYMLAHEYNRLLAIRKLKANIDLDSLSEQDKKAILRKDALKAAKVKAAIKPYTAFLKPLTDEDALKVLVSLGVSAQKQTIQTGPVADPTAGTLPIQPDPHEGQKQ